MTNKMKKNEEIEIGIDCEYPVLSDGENEDLDRIEDDPRGRDCIVGSQK